MVGTSTSSPFQADSIQRQMQGRGARIDRYGMWAAYISGKIFFKLSGL